MKGVAAGACATALLLLPASLILMPARAVAANRCWFAMPAELAKGRGRWLGPCRNGRANGSGVVRVVVNGAPVLWFGTMVAGRPGRGVISRNGDYYPQAGDTRAENVRGFDSAAAGARGAAQVMAGTNPASARFYRNEAIKLERTLD